MSLTNHTYEFTAFQLFVGLAFLLIIMWRVVKGMRTAHRKMIECRRLLRLTEVALTELGMVRDPIISLQRDFQSVKLDLTRQLDDSDGLEREVMESLGVITYDEARKQEKLIDETGYAIDDLSQLRQWLNDTDDTVRRIYDSVDDARQKLIYS